MNNMKIVCIGDSLTYGYGLYKEKCWVDILRKTLDVRVLNRGVNGDTSAGMLSRSFRDVVENKPDIVIIMGGSNDFIAGYNIDRVQENIVELIKEAHQFGIRPIVGIQIAADERLALKRWSADIDYNEINVKIKEYRNWIIKYCMENQIDYVDFYKVIEENRQCIEAEDIYIDGLHPTEFGHDVMSKCVIEVIEKCFSNCK